MRSQEHECRLTVLAGRVRKDKRRERKGVSDGGRERVQVMEGGGRERVTCMYTSRNYTAYLVTIC